jgi:uncharacterized membrane protein YcaP (DUF421 family)
VHWWLPEVAVSERIIRALIVYIFLLVMFRVLGKRQVGQMTPFDLIVLLILSNMLQNAMIGPDNSVLEGIVGALTILAVNWAISRIAFDSPRLEGAIEGVPTVLIHNGKIVERNLRRETIGTEDLMSTLRTQCCFNVTELETALLEPSGKISLLKKHDLQTAGTPSNQTPPPRDSPR